MISHRASSSNAAGFSPFRIVSIKMASRSLICTDSLAGVAPLRSLSACSLLISPAPFLCRTFVLCPYNRTFVPPCQASYENNSVIGTSSARAIRHITSRDGMVSPASIRCTWLLDIFARAASSRMDTPFSIRTLSTYSFSTGSHFPLIAWFGLGFLSYQNPTIYPVPICGYNSRHI